MKTILELRNKEIIEHEGDLVIEGDVGENARILVTNGSLTLAGNIHSGAMIYVSLSSEQKPPPSRPASIVTSKGMIPIVRANHSETIDGVRYHFGSVSIGDRISTVGKVASFGNGMYEITVDSNYNFFSPMVTAIIYGLKYTGHKIRVEGENVFVDGQLSSGVNVDDTGNKFKKNKIIIKGAILDNVIINSDVEIEAGNIGKDCHIDCKYEGIIAGNIGESTLIKVFKNIHVQNVSPYVRIQSEQGGMVAQNIGERTIVNVRDNIEVGDVGDFSSLNTIQGKITMTGQVGKSARLQEKKTIEMSDVKLPQEFMSKLGFN